MSATFFNLRRRRAAAIKKQAEVEEITEKVEEVTEEIKAAPKKKSGRVVKSE